MTHTQSTKTNDNEKKEDERKMMMTKRERIGRNILVFGSVGGLRELERGESREHHCNRHICSQRNCTTCETCRKGRRNQNDHGVWNVMKVGNHFQELKYFQFQRMSGNLHLI